MRNVWSIRLMQLLVLFSAIQLHAQSLSTAQSEHPLVLTGTVPLPNVQGRIDHLGFDPKGRLFVSALGNNTEEVLDLSAESDPTPLPVLRSLRASFIPRS